MGPGIWSVRVPLVVPPGYRLSVPAGTTLRFAAEAGLISHGPLLFKGAANQAIHGTSAGMVPFYDIALGLGAILLLVGVIGAAVARKTKERVPPFVELKSPEQVVVGGPAVEPGLEPLEGEELGEETEEASPVENLSEE